MVRVYARFWPLGGHADRMLAMRRRESLWRKRRRLPFTERLPAGPQSMAGGYPCCCESTDTSTAEPPITSSRTSTGQTPPYHSCGGCCASPDSASSRYDVDLGVGGWVDGTCNACDLVAGSFTVTLLSFGASCSWFYGQNNWCTVGGYGPLRLEISLSMFRTGPTTCRFVLGIRLVTQSGSAFIGAGAMAQYSATISTSTSCIGAFTLNRDFNFAVGICTGTLPASIVVTSI